MNHLTEADIDKALSREQDSIVPSSGFAISVMAAIAEGKATPPELRFPWERALPGFVASALIVVLLVAAFVVAFGTWQPSASVPTGLQAVLEGLAGSLVAADAKLILTTGAIAAACLTLTRRLMLPGR